MEKEKIFCKDCKFRIEKKCQKKLKKPYVPKKGTCELAEKK